MGGYPKGKIILEGPSSDERSSLALSFAADGLRKGEYVMVVTSTISPTKVRMILRKLGVDVKVYEREGKLVIVDWFSHSSSNVPEIEEIGAVIKCPGDTLSLNEAFHKAFSKFPAGSKHRAVVDGISSIIGQQDIDTAFLLANSLNTTFGDDQSTVLFVVDSEMHNSTTMSTLERGFDGRIELKRIKGEGSVIGEISIHSMKETDFSDENLLLEKADDESLRIEGSGVQAREIPAEKEMADLVDSLKEDSRNETNWFGLGVHYASEKDYDKAQECFDAALKIRPSYVAAWISKANLYIEQGRNDEALRCYQHALNPGPDKDDDGEPEDPEGTQEDSEQRVCPECGTPVAVTDPFCLSCGMDIPEQESKSPQKAGSIEKALEACEKRIEKDRDDADAWFVKGLCLARLERYEDAVVALNEATRLNFEYPGLWIVKGKVYSKLGDEKKASLSIQRGIELARKDTSGVGPTFECSICGEDVNVKADQCSNCGARFKPLKDEVDVGEEEMPGLGDELEGILKKWETELADLVAPKETEKDLETEDAVRKRPARKVGLTNGLAKEEREGRITGKPGLTNGVKGRTNGLTNGLTNGVRGRTNGLTNGVKGRTNGLTNGVKGRTNGLTNGVRGRTNGLTNGLTNGVRGRTNGLTNGVKGRTNGLTNGVKGRTNGLTNGVRGRTNGLTNGLTNGVRGRTNGLTNGVGGRTNGLTNGVKQEPEDLARGQVNGLGRTTGVTNGLSQDVVGLRVSLADGLTNGNGITNGLGVNRYSRENRLAKWKLYLVPIVALALLITPVFYMTESAPSERIAIDGNFTDWQRVNIIEMDPSGLEPDVDIVGASVEVNEGSMFIYLEVLGGILTGDQISETGDAFHILIDSDRDYRTGYLSGGLGADYYVEIAGLGGQIRHSRLWEFPFGEDQSNWNSWTDPKNVLAATDSGELEIHVSRGHMENDADEALLLIHSLSWNGDQDSTDHIISASGVTTTVLQRSALLSQTVQGFDQNLLNIEVSAENGQVTLSSVDVEIKGTVQASDISSLKLVDSQNQVLDQILFYSNPVTFEFDPVVIDEGGSTTLVVRADFSGGNSRTIGAEIPSATSLGIDNAAPTLTYVSSTFDIGYIGTAPSLVTIDGGFADWANCTDFDEADEPSTQGDTNIDIGCYANELSQGHLFTYFDVSGRVLAGTDVPRNSPIMRQLAPSVPDSDRDTVPDQYDTYPNDFDNNNEPDIQASNDVDGDLSVDYPLGPDFWLNTTIPSDYPPPYANLNVSLYIGPIQRPEVVGEDVARVYIDADNSTSTGYSVQNMGADYLMEIRGRNGMLRHTGVMEFMGASPGEWMWNDVVADVDVDVDSRRLEASLDISGLTLQPDYVLSFETGDWGGGSDLTDESSGRGFSDTGTRHFADANGGYGLVAPDGGTIDITIDGTIDESNELDWISIAKTDTYGSYIKTYVVYDSTDLYVAIEVIANGTGEGASDDYAEIAFDTSHDGDTSPDTDDYKFKVRDPVGTPVMSEAQGDGSTWDETWSPGSWSGSASDTDTYVTFEFRIPLEYVFGTSTPSDGDIGGFCVHMFKENLTTYYYWPDATGSGSESNGREDNPSQWGDLHYTRPRLVINEVSPLTSPEWVELHNAGDSIDINGIVLSDQDGFSWTMSSSLVVPNNVYLILMSGSGTDDTDLSDGNGTIYIGTTEFTDAGDDVLLKFGGNDMGFDYLQYGSGGDVNTCPTDAASENSWTGTLSAPTGTDSAGRDKSSSDTNSSSDWDNTGGPDVSQRTRGHVNYLASLTVTGTDKAPSNVVQGENPVVMLQLAMSADYGWIEVTGLDVNRTGTSSIESDISEATIWEDVDGDGEFDSGTDTFLASGTYDDTYYSFSGFSFNVQSGTSTKMLVVYNISSTANTGVTVGARVDGESNVTIAVFDTVASFSAIPSTNSTINGNELLVYGGDITPGLAFRSEDSIEILNITLSVEYASVTVTQIDVTLTGTGLDSDIDEAVLYDDVNDDGDYDAGTDTPLRAGTYSSGVYSFSSLSISVSAGTDENLLVMYNISATATLENTVGGKINDENDITVQSPDSVATLSSISSSNVPIRYSDIFVIEDTGEVYESTDGGKTFSNPGDAGANIVAICANKSNTDIYAFEDNGGVYLSTDKGQNWNLRGDAFSGAATGIDMTIDNNDVIYLIRSTGVAYSSTDGGATFTTRADAGNQIAGIEANYSNNDLYVVTAAGAVFFSSDSGDTWSSRGDASSGNDVEDIAINTAGYIYVLEGTGEVYRSMDYGNTFSQLSDIGDLTYLGITIDFSYNYIYVVADDGNVYLSTDGASTWMLRSDIGSQTDYEDITCIIIPEFPPSILLLLAVILLLVPMRTVLSRRKRASRSASSE
jgi:tetratricopeptide (TPR) repeat protein/photosystem II stability/assembly factor-like uncharacterized protein